mgnify:CR=1 FL=1
MRKYVLATLALILTIGFFTLGAEEVMVPFRAIKSSCYGKIDMTKAEFPLSEVGKECVQNDWLEENLSEEEAQAQESEEVAEGNTIEEKIEAKRDASFQEMSLKSYIPDRIDGFTDKQSSRPDEMRLEFWGQNQGCYRLGWQSINPSRLVTMTY